MKPEPTYCFIINCASNAHRAEAFFKDREQYLKSAFKRASFVYIREGDSIIDIVRDQVHTYTHIIACGGDGTINRVANGMLGSGSTLGVIPLGSGNDFAKNIGLGRDFDDNVETLKANKCREIDVIQNEWGFILNTFGMGVDGLTNYYASKSPLKNASVKYFWGGLKALVHSKPFTVHISIEESSGEVTINQSAWMVALANGKTEGGKYRISPQSDNADGIVEVIIVHSVSRLRLITEFIKLSLGLPFKKGVVSEYKLSQKVSIKAARQLKAHADGEQVSESDRFDFNVLKGALRVVVAQ